MSEEYDAHRISLIPPKNSVIISWRAKLAAMHSLCVLRSMDPRMSTGRTFSNNACSSAFLQRHAWMVGSAVEHLNDSHDIAKLLAAYANRA